MMTLSEAIRHRRSFYDIKPKSPISDREIIDMVEEALAYTPSAFNMQSARIVLLMKNNHHLFWDTVKNILRQMVPADKFAATETKIDGFGSGYGTVLFFDDTDVVRQFSNDFPLYKDRFSAWAEQANGMLQSNVWMLLEEAGLGASLQHYNPIIDDSVHQIWDIPVAWRLIAQMPFGTPGKKPGNKEIIPVEKRIKIFGK